MGSPVLEPEFASDPLTWQEAFESHWTQADALMRGTQGGAVTQEHIIAIFKHMDQMILLLLTEVNAQPEPSIGPILNQFFTDDMLSRLVGWSLSSPALFSATCQVNLLKLYEGIVTQCHSPHHCLLVHKPILFPLLHLLEWCQKSSELRALSSKTMGPSEVEKHFLLLLNQICTKMAEDSTLLEFFFNNQSNRSAVSENEGSAPRFLVFTLMIPYLYDPGDVGQLARDALLLVLSVSRSVQMVGQFIARESNFCQVLGTGLSGCFSQLPRRLSSVLSAADDWHRITMHDIEREKALQEFYSGLLFCNAVVQVGHRLVQEHLLEFIYHGFLVSVVRQALFETGLEELISATAYLELCFRTVTEPSLMRILIKFLLTEHDDGKRILETLVERITTNTKLCLVSLALIETLLDLHCEDLMLELVLKYLLPCTHIMASQVQNVSDMDLTSKAATKFMSLIPRCAVSNGNWQSSGSESSLTQDTQAMEEIRDHRLGYLEYLSEAHTHVTHSLLACQCWSLPYDGMQPDPQLFREETVSSSEESSVSSPRSHASSVFQRRQSIRRSARLNQYFTRRHTSTMTAGAGLSALDMSILGADFLTDDIDSVDDFEMQDAETSSPEQARTPRYRKAVPDYFKLAYDEDMESNSARTTSDSQEESDGQQEAFILSGWTQLNDLNTFIEVLDHVRASTESSAHSLDDNLAFLESRLNAPNPAPQPELTESKDSGVDVTSSMVRESPSAEAAPVDVEEPEPEPLEEIQENREQIQTLDIPPLTLGIAVQFKSGFGNPTLGPFLNALLQKLDNFLGNTLFVNLHLTAVFSKLASYPQPLLRSLLLNHALVFQPSIRSIFQIVGTLKQRIDQHALGVDNFDSLLQRGWRFLHNRERRFASERSSRASSAASKTSSFSPMTALELQGFSSTEVENRARSFSEIFAPQVRKMDSKHRAESTAGVEPVNGAKGYKYYQHKTKESHEATLDAMRTKNVVYCAIVLQEFLQEMAAISQEHAVVCVQCNNY